VLRTLDLVSEVAARLDADDSLALTELMLEAVEELGRRADGEALATRLACDRTVTSLDQLRTEVEARDPAEALELALEAMDDVARRVDGRADDLDDRLANIEYGLTGLAELTASMAGAVAALAAAPSPELAPPSLDDGALRAIADRVADALMLRVEPALGGATERVLERVEASTERVLGRIDSAALPAGDHAVVTAAAAAMSRLEVLVRDQPAAIVAADRMVDLTPAVDPRQQPADGPRPATAEVAARMRASANSLLAGLRARGRASRR
jgi:hypothetical protein